jgi:hypothetical protein
VWQLLFKHCILWPRQESSKLDTRYLHKGANW